MSSHGASRDGKILSHQARCLPRRIMVQFSELPVKLMLIIEIIKMFKDSTEQLTLSVPHKNSKAYLGEKVAWIDTHTTSKLNCWH